MLRRFSKGIESAPSINASDIAVYRIYEGQIQNLMSENIATGETIVNTMDLSEDMEDIYNEYINLK